MQRFRFLALFLFTLSATAQQVPRPRFIDIVAPDGLKLKATFFAATSPAPGVILLHQCNRQRKVWDELATRMAASGLNVMTLDLRGYGDSEGTPVDKLSPEQGNIVFTQKIPADIEAAYKVLFAQPGVSHDVLGAGGASCGVNQSVHLAMNHPEIKALVLLSEFTDLDGRNFLRAHRGLPLFLATADDDEDPGVSELMTWISYFSSNTHTQLVRYKTGGHGVEMFEAHPELPKMIVDWLATELHSPSSNVPTRVVDPGRQVQFLEAIDRTGGGIKAANLYSEIYQPSPKAAAVPEAILNRVGYDHLQSGNKQDAIGILKLNASLYPQSPNAYDSLADAYLADGQNDLARQNTQKALELLATDTTDSEGRRKEIRESAEQKRNQLGPPR
jgi:dienelactone hydrolase